MRKLLKLTSWVAIAGLAWTAGYIYNARYGGELSWLRIMVLDSVARGRREAKRMIYLSYPAPGTAELLHQ